MSVQDARLFIFQALKSLTPQCAPDRKMNVCVQFCALSLSRARDASYRSFTRERSMLVFFYLVFILVLLIQLRKIRQSDCDIEFAAKYKICNLRTCHTHTHTRGRDKKQCFLLVCKITRRSRPTLLIKLRILEIFHSKLRPRAKKKFFAHD